jgi:peroxin-1
VEIKKSAPFLVKGSLKEILVKAKHFELAVEDHVPIGLHGIDLKPSVDNRIAWSDVGGLTHAKKIIVETLKWPTQVCKLSFLFPFLVKGWIRLHLML